MIITPDFILLNYPKTGTTFAREIVSKAYAGRQSVANKLLTNLGLKAPDVRDLMLPKLRLNGALDQGYKDQHGKVRQIPDEFADRDVVSIFRDPVSRYLSMYHYRRWLGFAAFKGPRVKEAYPNFPDLSFDEYLSWLFRYEAPKFLPIETKNKYGYQTLTFIHFYFRDPAAVLRSYEAGRDDYIREFESIRFLQQESLNADLKKLLCEYGFTECELEFISKAPRRNESKNSRTKTEISESASQMIMEYDRFLYSLFGLVS